MSAASIEWDDVVLVAPELATLPEDTQDLFLSYVNDETVLGPGRWPSPIRLKLARVYLAAHLGTTATGAGGMGQVIEVQEGDALTKFAEASKTSSSLGRTWYGQEYQRLARGAGATLWSCLP